MDKVHNINIKNKTVILRCDFNVPIENGQILDDSKIVKSLKTIDYLQDSNCKIILMSHLGRVKKEEDIIKHTLKPVADYLSKIYKEKFSFIDNCRSSELTLKAKNLNPKDILLLENTRHQDFPEKLESGNNKELAEYWASLGDVFCLDAFGSAHRAHASTAGIAKFIPSCIGFLIEEELENLKLLTHNPEHPFTVIMGGAKVDDKIALMRSLLPMCDYLLVTGGIANTFLKVLGFNVGSSLASNDSIILNEVKSLLLEYKNKIILPIDVIVTNNYDKFYIRTSSVNNLDVNDIIYDVGVKTLEKFALAINKSKIIFVNGTCGLYEDVRFSNGTKECFKLLANSGAKIIVGGGDSVSAVKKFGYQNKFHYLSSGGGATLDYIVDGKLDALVELERGMEIETLDV
ncbi:MAG: phosphoglycerate kinase [Bacilli bacterium]|nr:phosphoglycerate kinase [Bacilli bacterium]